MAEYRKKSSKNASSHGKRKSGKALKHYSTVSSPKKNKGNYSDISMNSSTRSNRRKAETRAAFDMKLIMGKKESNHRRHLSLLIVGCLLLVAIVIFSALTPTGPFEYLENKFMSLGNGSFPADISGSELLDCYTADSLIYTLSDTHAEVFNSSGKRLFSRQHDFNSPTLCVSSQRALLYDLGGRNLYVFNNNDVINELTSEFDIYSAAIGRNGTVAIASKSKGYASQVQVLSKSGKEKFVWFSSLETINNVAVSNNGKRIAVSTVTTSGGQFKSKVYIFKYSSPDPIYEFSYDSTVIYSIENISSSRFSVVTDETVDYINWKSGERVSNTQSARPNIFKVFSNKKSIAVLGNKSLSTILLFDASGSKITQFEFLSSVTDIALNGELIYILSDSYAYVLDYDGNQVADMLNISGYNRILSLKRENIISLGNFGLNKYIVEQENE